MIEINLNNVEELIFFEKDLAAELPDFRKYYDQWRLARTNPSLKAVGKKAIVEFLLNITENQKSKIEEKFGEKVYIDSPLTSVRSYKCDIDMLENLLNQTNPYGYPRLYRKGKEVYITVWR
jgi:hypothetical protein